MCFTPLLGGKIGCRQEPILPFSCHCLPLVYLNQSQLAPKCGNGCLQISILESQNRVGKDGLGEERHDFKQQGNMATLVIQVEDGMKRMESGGAFKRMLQ